MIICPHCRNHKIPTGKLPKDVVVVMPCPSCHELVLLFRNTAIPVNRTIIEQGTYEQRREHLADIVGACLEAGQFTFGSEGEQAETGEALTLQNAEATAPSPRLPITQEEIEHFLTIELPQLDDPASFRKYFGPASS